MKDRVKQIMAYFYMPLFFALIGYGIVYAASLPVLNTIIQVGNIITSDGTPDFTTELDVVYDEDIASNAAANHKESVNLSEISMPSYGMQYAYISCDRISFKAPVFWGDNSSILKNGIGQYIGSNLPGFNSTIMLCGHNTTYCLPLQYITEGDIITVKTNYGTYEYEVAAIRVASMNDPTAYNLGLDTEQLIIYTCYPFDMLGDKINRMYVYGTKISGPTVNGLN